MDQGGERQAPSKRLPTTVILLGVVSLLTDTSSEMVFPLLPAFLAARIPNAPILTGAMEGLADLIASGATLAVTAFYGLYHAFAEGAERALLADLAPASSRGRAFGAYYALAGVAALLGGLLFGTLWEEFTSATAFLTAGGISAVSLVLLMLMLPRARAEARAAR